ncbi:uncharacterized protein LOC134249018 [Saccostrea cucullata]|uniref:uncharacterized protein LOC134249018 n=1 Tax=Saccostrea cuccullata TaxID=36930 RepID=UPI002ED430C5
MPLKQWRLSLKFMKCYQHLNKECELYCEKCAQAICVQCVVKHQGHKLSKIEKVFVSRKEVFKKELDELQNKIYPKYKETLCTFEDEISKLNEDYVILHNSVEKQGEEWHKEIKKIVEKQKSEIEKLKQKHHVAIKNHEDKFKQVMSQLYNCIQHLKNVVESNDMTEIFTNRLRYAEFRILPPKQKIVSPIFYPREIDAQNLCDQFGYLSPLYATIENSKDEATENGSSQATHSVCNEPELITTLHTKYVCHTLACLNDDKIWTCSKYQNTMKLITVQGTLLKLLKTKSGKCSEDIAVTNSGDLFYTDSFTKTVNLVKDNIVQEVVTLADWRPYNIYCKTLEEFLVFVYSDDFQHSKVVRYFYSKKTKTFNEKLTIQFDDKGNSLFSMHDTKYLCENGNLDLCVADHAAGAIIVVDQFGNLRFRYTGPYFTIKQKPFQPRGISTDSKRRILTADHSNECIHVLDQNGHFLCYIDCGLRTPWGLCVDSTDHLIVSEYSNRTVKKIRYDKTLK